MTVLEFVASLVSSLAWPSVVVIAIVLLRGPITILLPLLRRLKYKEIEVEFAETIRDLREDVDALPQVPGGAPLRVPEEEKLLKMAAVSPRAAVLEAWRLLESEAKRTLADRGEPIPADRPLTGPALSRKLQAREVLDDASRETLDRLRHLRNQAAHADEFALDENLAREYVGLALAMTGRIAGARNPGFD